MEFKEHKEIGSALLKGLLCSILKASMRNRQQPLTWWPETAGWNGRFYQGFFFFFCPLTDCWSLALMVLTLSGSQMTMSASEPTAIRPLRGYRLKILAALVEVTATNWFSSILPMAWQTEEHKFRTIDKLVFTATQTTRTYFVIAHHSFVPYETHSFLNSVGSLWDQSEVIFPDCFLGGAVRAVSAAHHLQVPTVSKNEKKNKLETQHWLTIQISCPCSFVKSPQALTNRWLGVYSQFKCICKRPLEATFKLGPCY